MTELPPVRPIWFNPDKDEVLFTFHQWFGADHEFPVTLCRVGPGRYDLHAQTGECHEWAIEKAREMLAKRGLIVDLQHEPWIGPTGAYYDVFECVVLPVEETDHG